LDPALFRKLLKNLLDDFAYLAGPSSRRVQPSLADQASRLHKLRGGACMLGAKAIEDLAAEAKAACLAGNEAGARQRSIEIVAHMDAVRNAVKELATREL